MRTVRNIVLFLCWLTFVAVLNYELVQKAPATRLGDLPGSELADRADRKIRFRKVTGVKPVDRALHEGHEAYRYYRGLATGSLH